MFDRLQTVFVICKYHKILKTIVAALCGVITLVTTPSSHVIINYKPLLLNTCNILHKYTLIWYRTTHTFNSKRHV